MEPFRVAEGLLSTGDTCVKIEVLKQISPLLVSCEFATIRIYMRVGKSFFHRKYVSQKSGPGYCDQPALRAFFIV